MRLSEGGCCQALMLEEYMLLRINIGLGISDADLAAADAGAQIAGLERFLFGRAELVLQLDGGQPEAELVGEVVAGAARAVALDEGSRAEVLQARAGAGQRLTAALRSRRCVHDKTVSHPETAPAFWTVWYFNTLTVNGYHIGRRFTHNTS